ERHNNIAVDSPWCGERGFLLIFLCKADLIVSRKSIHKGQHLIPCGVVDQDINVRKWEVVLRTGLIQISEVNTNADLPILLDYRDYIGHPHRVENDSDKFCCM